MAETTLGPDDFAATAAELERVLGSRIAGQDQLVRDTVIALLAGGHVLLEGVPGLGKTMLVRAVGEALELRFSRIQFTPDLMPADIVGTTVIQEGAGGRELVFQAGPVFANLVLADEINRATPKTQSALLEAMQEQTVTVGSHTRPLPRPFFVLATQNPIELEGTYPLPEAQLDRFLFKLLVPFPSDATLAEVVRRTTGPVADPLQPVAGAARVEAMIELARTVPVAEHVVEYAVRLVSGSHPDRSQVAMIRQYVRYGVSPRGVQALILAGKVRALLEGRFNVAYEDVRAVAPAALRHRIFLGFEADAAGVAADDLIERLLDEIVVEPAAA